MAEEGIAEATLGTAKAHPWIVGGSVIVLVGLLWIVSRNGSTAAPQQFSFSYGPTQAETVANAALQATQSQNQAQASIANSYFDYLTQSTASTNTANAAIAGINSTTAMRVADDASNTAVQQSYYATIASNVAADDATNAANTAAGYAYQSTVSQQTTAQDQIFSNERIAGNQQYLSYQEATQQQSDTAAFNTQQLTGNQQVALINANNAVAQTANQATQNSMLFQLASIENRGPWAD